MFFKKFTTMTRFINILSSTVYFLQIFVLLIISFKFGKSHIMRAVVIDAYGLPEVLTIKEVPIPSYSSRQVLVRVKAIGINHIDINLRAGKGYKPNPFPYTLGKEFSGIVEGVGNEVQTFKLGDRVMCWVAFGAYAEYVAANDTQCYPLSKKLTFSEGACICMTYFVAHRAIAAKGKLTANQTFIVHGASGNFGVAAVQIGKDLGACVIASVRNENVRRLMAEVGADYICYHDIKTDYYLQEALNATQRSGYDVFLETLSNINLSRNMKYLEQDGKIIILGKSVSVNAGRQRLRNGRGYVYTVSFFRYPKEEQDRAIAYVLDAIERGALKPIVANEYRLDQVRQAHADMSLTQACKGKLVLTV